MSPIPDASHLLALRKRLWEGRASVLVGSGFSRSATTVNPEATQPPLWNGIAEALKADLYPNHPGHCPSDPLRLAQEYETTLSRDALHERIADCINDGAHEPSLNHKFLLQLPWSDVFTTNYDTLLERTRRKAGRRYDVVRTPQGLPQATEPRIVKLHGSLPDIYPFIITEEDYRQYPQTHGAFVSLARTRLVEHSLVMVGFSGDDPNFLQWSGWVRDHLGPNAPPLYVVTLGLSAPKRRLFEKRGIAPIDLAPVFEDHPGDIDKRHHDATRAFLCELHRGQPSDPQEWPKHSTVSVPDHVRLLNSSEQDPDSPTPFDFPQPVTIQEQAQGYSNDQELQDLIAPWKAQRERYPGWVVAPIAIRDHIWEKTKQWSAPLFQELTSVDSPEDLRLAQEFIWRLDVALIPIFPDEIETLLTIAYQYNPHPQLFDFPESLTPEIKNDADLPYTRTSNPDWNWKSLTEAWVEVALSVLRSLRTRESAKAFNEWKKALASIVEQSAEWTARFWYQVALHQLERQNLDAVRKIVGESQESHWRTTTDRFPMGEVWRSGILAEIGELETAESLLQTILERLNHSLAHSPSLTLESQQAWAQKLLQHVEFAIHPYSPEKRASDSAPTWSDLEEARHRFRELGAKVDQAISSRTQGRTAKFDLNRYSEPYPVGGRYPFHKHRYGIAYLRIYEESGMPLRIGDVQMNIKRISKAINWARPYTPFFSYVSSLRSASKEIGENFSRHRVSGLSRDHVEKLCCIAKRGCEEAARLNEEDKEGASRLKTLVEVYSRLVIGNEKLATEAIEVAIETAKKAPPRLCWANYKTLGDLVRRAAESIGDSQLASMVPHLIEIPVAGRDVKTNGHDQVWFEPFERMRGVSLDSLELEMSPVKSLIRALRGEGVISGGSDSIKERQVAQSRAATRLQYLYVNGGLNADMEEQLAEAYWGLAGSDDIPILKWKPVGFALSMPEPLSGKSVRDRVRQTLMESVSKPIGADLDHSFKKAQRLWSLRHATKGVFWSSDEADIPRRFEWTSDEVSSILEFVNQYWQTKREQYHEVVDQETQSLSSAPPQVSQVENAIEPISLVLGDVIAPYLDTDEAQSWELLLQILQQLESEDFPTAIVYPALLRSKKSTQKAIQRIRMSLSYPDESKVEHGVNAVYRWCGLYDAGVLNTPAADLIVDLARHIAIQRRPGLALRIEVMKRIVQRYDSQISDKVVGDLLKGLNLLFELSKPPSDQEAWTAPEQPEIEFSQRRERPAATRLAASLCQWFRNLSTPIPHEVARWGDMARNSNLPEVRRAWDFE